jgi:hypothetical protein
MGPLDFVQLLNYLDTEPYSNCQEISSDIMEGQFLHDYEDEGN